jgi:hypothetical protein
MEIDTIGRTFLIKGVKVGLEQTNTKLTPKIQAYVLFWCKFQVTPLKKLTSPRGCNWC